MLRTHRISAMSCFTNRWQIGLSIVFAMALGSSARAANVPVLPLEEGLTIARAEINGDVRLFAVLADDGETLRAVDLEDALKTEADAPLTLLKSHDLSTIAETVQQAQNSGRVVDVDRGTLAVPIDIAEQSVAVAVNYPSHAAEVNTEAQQPFVFPKRSDAEPWNATLEIDNIVLPDYEIEVGVISDRPIKDSSDLDNARLGFVLANDVTSRDAIARGSFTQSVRSTVGKEGVATSKSGEGRLQIGPYVVFPNNWRDFMRRIELRLDVNSEVRQRDVPAAMAEGILALTERMLQADDNESYAIAGTPVKILPDGVWQPGTLLLTGTPGGTSYRAPEITPEEALSMSAEERQSAIDTWTRGQEASGRYLEADDTIDALGTFLGTLKISVQ